MALTAYLYNCGDDPRVLNKTLGEGLTVSQIRPTESCDLLNPIFILDYNSSYTSCNYVKVGTPFNRSYFITDMKVNIGQKITISCTVDVLQTYKTDIENLNVNVVRNETPGDLKAPYMPDPLFNIEAGYQYDYKQFSNKPFTPSGGKFILSWVGDEFSENFIRIDVEPADWSTSWGKYYYYFDDEYIPLLTNYPYEAPSFSMISSNFGVFERTGPIP